MKETLNNEYYNIDNILHNNIISGMYSPAIINTPNISYYGNSPSPYVEQDPGGQEMKNEATPLLNINFEQNSPGVQKEEKNEGKIEEMPGKTIETKKYDIRN